MACGSNGPHVRLTESVKFQKYDFALGPLIFESDSVEDGVGPGFGPKVKASWAVATVSAQSALGKLNINFRS